MTSSVDKIVSKELIKLDFETANKEEVMDWIINTAKKDGYLRDTAPFKEAVMKREGEMPTAIGYNVAIPHGKSDVVQKPFVGFVRTTDEFLWAEGHEEKVDLIFLIGVPQENKDNVHLKFISTLSKKLLDEDFRESLIKAKNQEDVYKILNN